MATKILRLPGVLNLVGLKKSTVYKLVRQGDFPPPIKLGENSVGWVESEVAGWVERRIDACRQPGEAHGADATQMANIARKTNTPNATNIGHKMPAHRHTDPPQKTGKHRSGAVRSGGAK